MDRKELWKRIKNISFFGGLYLIVFFFIESRNVPIHIIHTRFDDMIPFCEYFIIPYTLWYFYVAGTLAYFGLNINKGKEYYQFLANMGLGLVIFVLVSFLYPNGQDLRPEIIVPENPFQWAVKFLYTIDTPTNILPSLHVYASIACDMALCQDTTFKKYPALQWCSHLLAFVIILSTMFLKQHSIVDVVSAIICNSLCYPLVYHKTDWAYSKKIRKDTQYQP